MNDFYKDSLLRKMCKLQRTQCAIDTFIAEKEFEKEYIEKTFLEKYDEIMKNYSNNINLIFKNINNYLEKVKSIYHPSFTELYQDHLKEFEQYVELQKDQLHIFFYNWQNDINQLILPINQINDTIDSLKKKFEVTSKEIKQNIKREYENNINRLEEKKYKYTQKIVKKTLQFQHCNTKNVKEMTEEHVTNQNFEKHKFNETINDNFDINEMKTISNAIKKLKSQLLDIRNSIFEIIQHEKDYLFSKKEQVNEKIAEISDEFEALTVKNPKDSQIYKKLNHKLNEDFRILTKASDDLIKEKVKHLQDFSGMLRDQQNKLENEVHKKIVEKSERDMQMNKEIDRFIRSNYRELAELKVKNQAEEKEIEKKLTELEAQMNIFPDQNTDIDMEFPNQEEYEKEIDDLQLYFNNKIEEEKEKLNKQIQKFMKEKQAVIDNEIVKAKNKLSALQKQYEMINAHKAPSFDNEDDLYNSKKEEYEQEFKETKKMLDLEYENSKNESFHMLEVLREKLSAIEFYAQEQFNKKGKQELRKIRSDRILSLSLSIDEEKYLAELERQNKILNNLPHPISFTSNYFEKEDKIIDNLSHQFFQLQNSIKMRKISTLSELKDEYEKKKLQNEKSINNYPAKSRKYIHLKQKLAKIKNHKGKEENIYREFLIKMIEENELMLSINEEKYNNITTQFKKSIKELKNNYLIIKTELNDQIKQRENQSKYEISNISQAIKKYLLHLNHEKKQIEVNISNLQKKDFNQELQQQIDLIKSKTNVQMFNENERYNKEIEKLTIIIEERRNTILNQMKTQNQIIQDNEISQLFEISQQNQKIISSIDLISKENRNQINDLKNKLEKLKEASSEQIKEAEINTKNTISCYERLAQNMSNEDIINDLIAQYDSLSHQHDYLMKEINKAERKLKKKIILPHNSFGYNRKYGIVQPKKFLHGKNFICM